MPGRSTLQPRVCLIEELDTAGCGFSYVCRRCDVWGRVPAGRGRRCWSCDRTDRLERR